MQFEISVSNFLSDLFLNTRCNFKVINYGVTRAAGSRDHYPEKCDTLDNIIKGWGKHPEKNKWFLI